MGETEGPVNIDDLPVTFQVKYLGQSDARGLWGIKHTRKPVDLMVAAAKALPPGQILPIVKLIISVDGVHLETINQGSKTNEFEHMSVFFNIESISYGVQLFQTIFLFLALAHDVLEWASKKDSPIAIKIRYCRDILFSALVVPYTCFVFTMFWSLYAIDRELVFPKVYDLVVPWWFNQCVHSNILALLVIETLLQPRRSPVNKKLELMLDGAVGIAYAIVYYSIYFFAGRWLYNVFGIMTWWQVCLFQILIWTSSYVFYEMQFPINRLIHGQESQPDDEKSMEKPELNGEYHNGEVKEVEEKESNGVEKNGVNHVKTDFKAPPFSTKSWSLKYRTIRNQFENSKL